MKWYLRGKVATTATMTEDGRAFLLIVALGGGVPRGEGFEILHGGPSSSRSVVRYGTTRGHVKLLIEDWVDDGCPSE